MRMRTLVWALRTPEDHTFAISVDYWPIVAPMICGKLEHRKKQMQTLQPSGASGSLVHSEPMSPCKSSPPIPIWRSQLDSTGVTEIGWKRHSATQHL